MSRVIVVKDDEDFRLKVEKAAKDGSKVCVDFNANWCGPCKAISPLFHELSTQYHKITFLSVDIEKCKKTASSLKITSIPAFHFYIGDSLVREQTGANKTLLKQNIKLLAENDKETILEKAVDEGEVVEKPEATEGDITHMIDLSRTEALNYDPDHPIADMLSESEDKFLLSDTDEQLIFNIAFRRVSSIKALKFVGPKTSGPLKVHLFINKLNMGFSEAEDYKPVQSFTLSPTDLEADTPATNLNFALFVRTDVLTIFVENNQDDLEQTQITRLIINGRSVA
eukprot:TRINITY_DN1302_c0_g1_i1.p1 TRINITY_DN1302_c0_g1~~TRINITY_DN1302_c0_g1_i1.p1  ORF type:complete len:294 (-),score=76.41 TRINITY_DN1302_c0_g1_i1:90-938(-)